MKAAYVFLIIAGDACDTSPAMIKKTYAAFIVNHGDALLRAHVLDLAAPAAANVVRLKRPKGSLRAS